MSTISANYPGHVEATASTKVNAVTKVTTILRLTYGLVPIVAGADKFTDLLANWDRSLSPALTKLLPFAPHTFMMIVGVIEIVAGLIVLFKPRIGALVVCLWLIGIAINLITTGQYYDVAVRDLVMSVGAYCLFTLVGNNRA
jgi:uncharacterized membrane protein YphA (DoxX/SURF4 family)